MLIICDKSSAPKHYNWADCIISLDDSPSNIEVVGPKHLLIQCEDVDDPTYPYGPNFWQMKSVIEHVKTCKVHQRSHLLVHCFAGVSRSTATAWGVLCHQGLSVEEAWAKVLRVRSYAWPNLLICQHFDKLLNLDGKMVALSLRIDAERRGKAFDFNGYCG